MKFLDDLPIASIVFIAGLALIFIGYLNDTISFDDAWKNLLFLGGGAGGIGVARALSNKGTR
jgi:hypothetical protein